MKIFIKLFCLILVMLINISGSQTIQNQNIKHLVKVIHPGVSTSVPLERTLIEVQNLQRKTVEYYMEVETVLCSDDQCRIDVIRIYWDTLGFYNRLEIPENIYLEKAEGKHFDRKDNEKLNSILSNKDCSLKNVYKEEVVGTESSDGVDGVSGATIILNTNDYVQGAVWTCYTLWHWANGDLYDIIRNISGDKLEINELVKFVKEGEYIQKVFGVEQLIRGKSYGEEEVSQLIRLAHSADYQLSKLIIKYMESAPSEIYYASIEKILMNVDLDQRKMYFNSLNRYPVAATLQYYERLVANIESWDSYEDVNRLLNLLDNKQICSNEIIKSILPLLSHSDFVVARRVYWFLAEKKVSAADLATISSFYEANKERL